MPRRPNPIPLATALLAFALALPAGAQSERSRAYPGSGYPPYGAPLGDERVAELAHEVDELAEATYREFTRNNRRPDRAEARFIDDLRLLRERADRFHRRIEERRRYDRGRHDRVEFAALVEAFYAAADTTRWLRPRPYVDSRFDRIDAILDRLAGEFGRPRGYGHWRDRDGRYEGRGDHNGYYDPYGDRRYDDRRYDDRRYDDRRYEDRDRWDDRRDDDHDDD